MAMDSGNIIVAKIDMLGCCVRHLQRSDGMVRSGGVVLGVKVGLQIL